MDHGNSYHYPSSSFVYADPGWNGMVYHQPPPTQPPSYYVLSNDPAYGEKRITIWNRKERRKISGNAAPMGKNLNAYLQKHPDCEIFFGQDKQEFSNVQFHTFSPHSMNTVIDLGGACLGFPPSSLTYNNQNVVDSTEKRVTIWHKEEKRKISGNAAPMEKNLTSYLATHPHCEVYVSQDKQDTSNNQQAPSFSVPAPTISVIINPPHLTIDPPVEDLFPNQPMYQSKSAPITIPEDDTDEQTKFEEGNLTPPNTFSYETKLEKTGIPITTSPATFSSETRPVIHMDMSPVDSLASSFQTMDFSVGSQPYSLSRHTRGSLGATSTGDQFDVPQPIPRSAGSHDMGDRSRSNTLEDYGVMGPPEM